MLDLINIESEGLYFSVQAAMVGLQMVVADDGE